MTRHLLKAWPQFFNPVYSGQKPFEIRKNDRNFKVGDILVLREFFVCDKCEGLGTVLTQNEKKIKCPGCDGLTGRYTGREVDRKVTYITDFMQQPGFVVMAIEPIIEPQF